jgi:putative ATPase
MSDLFQAAGLTPHAPSPLADRLRPQTLDEVVGQEHLLGPDGPIGRMAAAHRLASMILWGPPGTGKTTIARLLAKAGGYEFQQISAVFSGVADLKKAFEQARVRRMAGQSTLLFVDEIHRFNRAQQDGFLPFVEEGIVTLVGATTENPSFELNGALLSRCQVFVLKRLDEEALEALLVKAEAAENRKLPLDPDARSTLVAMADGDGRYLLTLTETLLAIGTDTPLNPTQLASSCRSAARPTTRTARSTTIWSRRSISRCAAAIRTRRCTGWRGCWRAARTRCSSPGAWCAWRPRTSAPPIR